MIATMILGSKFVPVCCGIMVIMLIIGIISSIAGEQENKKSSDKSTRKEAKNRQRPEASNFIFQSHVSTGMKDFGEISMKAFTIEMQGPINAPINNCPVLKTITLFDITNDKDDLKPVLCSLDNLQYQNTTAFFSSTMDILPYMRSLLSAWQPMLSVPVETLTFPARGNRQLLFEVSIIAPDKTVLAKSQSDMIYTNTRPGYLDSMKTRLRAAELAVKLAVSVSATDGNLAGTEGRVVKEWIQKRIASSVESQKQEVKLKLNSAVESAMIAAGSANPEDIIPLCCDLIEMNPIPASSIGDKYDILELCLKVASADGKAMDTELELVNSLAENLGVDRERFRTMIEKTLPVNIHQTEDINRILDIDTSWSVEQKKKHLRKENRKWRALATHSDPEKQQQARHMQELIANAMALLEGSDEEG